MKYKLVLMMKVEDLFVIVQLDQIVAERRAGSPAGGAGGGV